MVGVPGRSKACSTCRARKKGCDRKLPSCSQCLKADLVCGGYSREQVWVAARPNDRRVNATYGRQAEHRRGIRQEYGDASDVTLHASLTRSAREEMYVGLYWTSYLPGGRQMSSKASSLSAGGWIAFLGELSQTEPALHRTILAISASLIGSRDDNSQLRMKGLQTYNAAVDEMSRAVKDPSRASSDGVLAAGRMMGSYEVLFGITAADFGGAGQVSQIKGWQGHADGEMSLVKLRGPGGFTTGAGHHLFVDGRMDAISIGITRRKASMFAGPEWKVVPWGGHPKTLKDKLLDHVLDIPGYLEEMDNMELCNDFEERDAKQLALLVRCNKTHQALVLWESEAASKIQRFDYIVTGLPVPELSRDHDLAALHLACFYWAMCIQLYLIIGSLRDKEIPLPSAAWLGESSCSSPSYNQTAYQTQSSEALEIRRSTSPEVYARKIAHCVHLFFEPQAGGLAANLAILPFVIALFYFEQTTSKDTEQSDQIKLLTGLFDRPFLGTCVGRFVAGLRTVLAGV